jgi:hypothetical protein
MADDTMTPNCLELLVRALEGNPDAGIAHCNLTFIDENSRPLDERWEQLEKVQYYGRWIDREHIRIAPHDGVLYCVLGTMYTSLTQLLIRRSVFERIGLFETSFGSNGDFEWGLRAAWFVSTVHVPRKLATWRAHSAQSTKDAFIFSAAGWKQRCAMVESARRSLARIPGSGRLPQARLLTSFYRLEQLRFALRETRSRWRRCWILLRCFCTHPWVGATYVAIRSTADWRPAREAAIRHLFAVLNLDPSELIGDVPENIKTASGHF